MSCVRFSSFYLFHSFLFMYWVVRIEIQMIPGDFKTRRLPPKLLRLLDCLRSSHLLPCLGWPQVKLPHSSYPLSLLISRDTIFNVDTVQTTTSLTLASNPSANTSFGPVTIPTTFLPPNMLWISESNDQFVKLNWYNIRTSRPTSCL